MQEQKIQACFALAELQQLMTQSLPDQVIIIDVRGPNEYAEKHIPGAINIPIGDLASHINELSKQALIITVCGKGGGRSAQAASMLQELGFNKANYLCGGTYGWYA